MKKKLIAIIATLLTISLVLTTSFYLGLFSTFTVLGDAPSQIQEVSAGGFLTLEFSRPVKKNTLEDNIKLDPQINYVVKWENNRMAKIYPQTEFTPGQKVELSTAAPIKDLLGNDLASNLKMTFKFVANPQIVLALPQNETEVKNKIVVTFNRPMVALTSIDEDDKRGYPLKIEPAIKGKFRWLGTSALEFVPEDRFNYATEYKMIVSGDVTDITGGKMGEDYTWSFTTPRPQMDNIAIKSTKIGSTDIITNDLNGYQYAFNQDPLEIKFNQPVDLVSLKENLQIMESKPSSEKQKIVATKAIENLQEFKADAKFAKIIETLSDLKNMKDIEKIREDLQEFLRFEEVISDENTEKQIQSLELKAQKINQALDYLWGINNLNDLNPIDTSNLQFTPKEYKLDYFTDPQTKETTKEIVVVTPLSQWLESGIYNLELAPFYKSTEGDLIFKAESTTESTESVPKLEVTPGEIKAVESPALTAEDKISQATYKASFKGAPSVSVNSVSPPDKAEKVSSEIVIGFSTPMHPEEFANFISIEPKAEIFTKDEVVYLEYDDTMYRGYWELKPSTKYTVTISKDIADRYGRKLGQDYVWSFTTAPMDPNIYLEAKGQEFGVFEAGMPPMYRFNYVNIKKAHVGLAKLTWQDVLAMDKAKQNDWAFVPQIKNYQVLKEYDFDLPPNTDVVTTQNLEIAKYFNTADKKFLTGTFLLDLWSDEVRDYDGNIIHNTHIFTLTPYALTLKYTRNKAFVFASSLASGEPVANMKLSFTDLEGKVHYTSETNAEGMSEVEIDPVKLFNGESEWSSDFFVIGEKDGQNSFVGAKWNEGLEPWKFGLSENWPGILENAHRVMGKIYTDRPIYKPGETIYFKGIVRDFDQTNFTIPKGVKVNLTINNSNYEEIFTKEYTVSDFGAFNGEFIIPEDVIYGNFPIRAEIMLPNSGEDTWNNSVETSVWVTHFEKAPFKLEINVPQTEYNWGDKVQGTITAETFYGARLAKQKLNLNVNSIDYYFNRLDGEWYSFAKAGAWCWGNCNRSNHFILSEEKELDDQGMANFEFKIESNKEESDPAELSQVYTINASIYDQASDREVSGNTEIVAHYADIYLGIKTDEYMINTGEKAEFKVISLDTQGKGKANTKVNATLVKREYKTIKKQGVDGAFYYENETKDTDITNKSFTTDENGKASNFFTIENGGSYIIRVTSEDSKKKQVLAETEIWVSSREVISWPRANHDRIDIIADKTNYKIGDTAKLMIKSPYTNINALVTTEQDGILTKKLVKIESNAQVIEVPITENYVPNVYVSVILLKGRTGEADYDKETNKDKSQPEFKIGYIKLPVETASKKLDISIKTDKERYAPQEKVTLDLTVTDYEGKGTKADLAVMVVDLSLLALTGYTEPDIVSEFYSERGLGVKTSLTMSKFIERFRPGSKGGGGGDAKARGEFKNTAFWVASLITDANGKAKTDFKLPDNLTTWEITVIAQDQLHRFGANNSEFMETKRLIIDPALPQFLLPGDEIEIKTVITNRQTKAVNVDLSLELAQTNGLADENIEDKNATIDVKIIEKNKTPKITDSIILSQNKQNINLKADERQTVIFKVKAGEVGNLKFIFTAKEGTKDGAEDTLIENRPIRPLATEEVVSTSGIVEETAREGIFLPEAIMPNLGKLSVQVSPTLAYLLPQNLRLLRSYAYECNEQTISKIFPNALILKNEVLSQLFTEDEKTEVTNMMNDGLSKIYKNQNPDGSWGYFVYNPDYTDYLTAYMVIALEEMNKSGVTIDKSVISKAKTYLDGRRNTDDLINQGFMRWALSYSNWSVDDREYANKIANSLPAVLKTPSSNPFVPSNKENASFEFKDLPLFAQTYWAMYARDEKILETILESAKLSDRSIFFEEDSTQNWSKYWATNKRTTALALLALEELKPDHPYIPKMIHWLNNNRNHQGYGNTQENVWTLLALIRHIENEKLAETNATIKVNVMNESILEKQFKIEASGKDQVNNIFTIESASKSINDLPKNENLFVDFTKQGTGKINYEMVLSYFLPAENIEAREEGFSILREFYSLDGKKLDKIPAVGETFKIKLIIVAPNEGNFVAVEDFIPAGVTAINTAFAISRNDLDESLQNTGDNWWEWGVLNYFQHSEFRDDRVFLFADYLPAGVYEYEYAARVSHKGSFSHLPARVFEMYDEDRFGRSDGDRVEIK